MAIIPFPFTLLLFFSVPSVPSVVNPILRDFLPAFSAVSPSVRALPEDRRDD
jgi:hypothetical protein